MSLVAQTQPESGTAAASGLHRALQVIYAVAESSSPGVGVSALARDVDLPKAVVHRILKVLARDGFLAFDENTKRYSLGPRARTIGLAALRQLDVPGVARPFLQRLSANTAETATLSIRQGWSRAYVDQVLSPQEVRMWVVLGKPYPLHAGSSSKAILAALPEVELEEFLRHHELAPFTEATMTSPAKLRAEIRKIRELGYAVSLGERQSGAASVAAAIRNGDGTVFGSVSVCGPSNRFNEELQRRYGWLVAITASEISAAVGYRPR